MRNSDKRHGEVFFERKVLIKWIETKKVQTLASTCCTQQKDDFSSAGCHWIKEKPLPASPFYFQEGKYSVITIQLFIEGANVEFESTAYDYNNGINPP